MKSYRPTPNPLNVTGAAARSVAAADAAAIAWWNHADSLAAEVDRTLNAENPIAGDIVAAAEAWRAYITHNDTMPTLARRWQTQSGRSHEPLQSWGMEGGAMASASIVIERSAYALRDKLTNAGVPMAKIPNGAHTIEFIDYWRDAAARGC